MLLAAGRGERMRPLTDRVPKPLLEVKGVPLIVRQIMALADCGISSIVINTAHLGRMIEDQLGAGEKYGVEIRYSREETALETAGGIALALPLLGQEPFIVANADLYCDYDYSHLAEMDLGKRLAHLVLVPNPEHHPIGDFSLQDGMAMLRGENSLTFSGIGLYRPEFFHALQPGKAAKLATLLREAIALQKVSAERHEGLWVDVGTPERLDLLNR